MPWVPQAQEVPLGLLDLLGPLDLQGQTDPQEPKASLGLLVLQEHKVLQVLLAPWVCRVHQALWGLQEQGVRRELQEHRDARDLQVCYTPPAIQFI